MDSNLAMFIVFEKLLYITIHYNLCFIFSQFGSGGGGGSGDNWASGTGVSNADDDEAWE